MDELEKTDKPVEITNPTAKFVLGQSGFQHEGLTNQLSNAAMYLQEAKSPAERKAILDNELGMTISGYREIVSTMARYATFLVLSYKVEGLFWLDMEGMRGDFKNDREAYQWWVKEFLTQNDAPRSLRSKVKWYVNEENDLTLIDRTNFEKAWVICKYTSRLRSWGKSVPQEVVVLAESTEVTAKDITDLLDWEVFKIERIHEYLTQHRELPPPEVIRRWQAEHTEIRAAISQRYRRLKPPQSRQYEKLHGQLGGVVKGDVRAVLRVLSTIIEDILTPEHDLGEEIYQFLHSGHYTHCMVSNKAFGPGDPMAVHHIATRGAHGDRKLFNLVVASSSVHEEWHTQGAERTMGKYGITEEMLLAQAVRVIIDYIRWLQGEIQ